MLPNARTNDLVLQASGDELLVYDLITSRAICLNHTSATVWQMCDGKKSISDVAKELECQLGAAVDEKLVRWALIQLKEVDLLKDSERFSDEFEGLSRRELVRRIGLASVVALPIISSIVAPTAISAQSVACVFVANGCSCPNNTPTGTDCTATQTTPCANTACRCVDNGIGGPGGGDCVP